MEVILRGVSGRSFWVFGMGLVWCRWEMVGCGIGGRGRGRMWWGIVREGGCEGGISNVWSHTGQVPSITFHSVNIVRALDHSISPWSAGNANAGPCANIRRAQWSCATLIQWPNGQSALEAPLGAEHGDPPRTDMRMVIHYSSCM